MRFAAKRAVELQRSRALSSAEMPNRSTTTRLFAWLQRSRALSSAEIRATASSTRAPIPLQRSRALSSAEMVGSAKSLLRERVASTEPRSFERGDVKGHETNPTVPMLQRSRALSSAEIIKDGSVGYVQTWLQRSRALSSAEMEHSIRGDYARQIASTEPRSFERGDLPSPLSSRARNVSASTEPRSFERGDSFRLADVPIPHEGFNGAALFRARRSVRSISMRVRRLASTEPRSFERGDGVRLRTGDFDLEASTEPRSFERGDEARCGIPGEGATGLQRSRALSSAEIASYSHGWQAYP